MIPPTNRGTKPKDGDRCMNTAVRVAVMIWSASMLTAHYVGFVKSMDATFVAGLFTSTLATFGVTSLRRDDEGGVKTSPSKPKSSSL